MGMLPKIGPFANIPKDVSVDEKQLKQIEAIINSMTAAEREDADIIDGKRRKTDRAWQRHCGAGCESSIEAVFGYAADVETVWGDVES